MKTILTYEYDGDSFDDWDISARVKATDLALCIYELDEWLRRSYRGKEPDAKLDGDAAEVVMGKLRELLDDRDIKNVALDVP